MIEFWRERTGIDTIPSVYQLVFRCVDESKVLVGRLEKEGKIKLPQEMIRISRRDAYYRLGMTFEFIGVAKINICRERNFVELTNSEHCPPSGTHNQISNRYETIYVDHPIRQQFRNDGVARLSDKPSKQVKWPRGNYLRALAILNNDIDYLRERPKVFLNAARKVTRLGSHIGRSPFLQFQDISNWRARLLWMVSVPGGYIGYFRDRFQGRAAPKADSDMSAWGPAAPPENPALHPPPERFRHTMRTAALGPEIS